MGKHSEGLTAVGITSLPQLKKMGAVVASTRVKQAGLNASLNLLWALQGPFLALIGAW